MATLTPLPFFNQLFDSLSAQFQPPPWVVEQVHQRVVLLINHVLMQEPEAMARLARRSGSVARVAWRQFHIHLQVTPAGLLDLAPPELAPDLSLALTEESPVELVQNVLKSRKPAVRIEGDVQLAAEINWIAEHVRWDLEEDLSRVVGDGPAHGLVTFCQRAAQAVKEFVTRFAATSIVRDKDGA
jgi:ubiquinone biosynthesis protein UbiJ